MKSIIFIIILIIILCSFICDGKIVSSDTIQWDLVWIEDFKTDTLDTSIWSYMQRGKGDSWKYHSSNPKCYTLKNGKLVIKGIKNSDKGKDTATYLTGGITTKGKKPFAYGRIEIRAKLGSAKGAWPAFWLLPYQKENGWPADGEIDIMEHLNYDKFVYQTVHSAYTKADPNAKPKRFVKSPIIPDKYNIYRVDIFPDKVEFYVNDCKTLSYPKIDTLANEGQFPFAREWYLMLDMQLGGKWVGPIDPDDIPVQMEIDWIKYYQQK